MTKTRSNNKKLSMILAVLLVLFSFTACNEEITQPNVSVDIYNMADYESGEVFDFEKVNLSEDLSQKCCSYKFTYMSDGYKIKGYISIPNSSIESQELTKCVLYNRGGNRDFGKLQDDTTAYICALCNRIVIASQYRGGGGSEGQDQFGGDDLNDVIKLIDLCENTFSFIDMDDFCVVGVSRGGMMTYMAARQDNRIKKIIAASAVTDLFEEYERRKDMNDVLIETIGCTPQENPAEYEKRSAIYWYDEIKIPVMIIHSENDKQASYQAAKKMYEKLKDVTDCTFISHDDDFHGIESADYQAIRDWLN